MSNAIIPSAQESLRGAIQQINLDETTTSVTVPAKGFHVNLDDCFLWVKCVNDLAAVKGWYLKGMDYSREVVSVQADDDGDPVDLTSGDVTLLY